MGPPITSVLESHTDAETDLPYEPVGDLPTAVEAFPAFGTDLGIDSLYVKRDDRTGHLYGGNKVRKLEFLLADAKQQGFEDVWTIGSLGSNHVLATSLYARELDLQPHAIHYPEPIDDHVRDTLRALSTVRPDLELCGDAQAGFYAGLKRDMYRRLEDDPSYYYIPSGGATPVGELGYVNAALELRDQIDRGEVPEPDVIVVPAASGGTLSGLLCGCELADLDAEVVGVRVAMKTFGNERRVARLANRTGRVLADFGLADPPEFVAEDVTILHDYVGDGYGTVSPTAERASAIAADHGLTLDPTFTAKTVAALLEEDFGDETVLYWHTLSSVDLSDRIADANVERDLPDEYREFFADWE